MLYFINYWSLGKRKEEEQINIIEELESDTSALDNVNVVIIDESSMLSLDLFHSLLSALGVNRRLILVGDVDHYQVLAQAIV